MFKYFVDVILSMFPYVAITHFIVIQSYLQSYTFSRDKHN